VKLETEQRRKDGRIVPAEITVSPVVGDAGRVASVSAIVRDISERRQAEEALREALERAQESERLKGAFLANMSHEVRTPLNVILGYTNLLEACDLSEPERVEASAAMSEAAKRLIATIDGVLDLSRIETGGFEIQPSLLPLGELVETCVRERSAAAQAKGLELTAQIDVPDAIVRFDEYCLQQSLDHVVANAIKFTEQGRVAVRVRHDDDGRLCVEVEDTGVGIDPAFSARIFDRFTQEESGFDRRYQGAGLGLTLVRRYCELNGAAVSLASEKGRGSLFRIHFGAARASADERAPTAAPPLLRRRLAREAGELGLVLLVEDDRPSQMLIRAQLAGSYSVRCASTAEQARAILAREGGRIGAILMDFSLGGSEDGLSLTRSIRADERWSGLPIVAVTAHAFREDRARALAAGCDAFVAKPADRDVLLACLERFGKPPGVDR
jgi:signal transduction histidine kinase/ActR/RegA family two-component response regulator